MKKKAPKASESPKTSGLPWLGMLLYLCIGGACGALVVRYSNQFPGGLSLGELLIALGLVILSVYAAAMVQMVIHEAGHLVFGLATGYQFHSFRILQWMWVKEGGKLQLKWMKIEGTGGQCLMSPPDLVDGKIPALLYNLGGVLMNLMASILM